MRLLRRAPGTLDVLVEEAGRWTAARTTRRSFLGRVGKVAVMVASGPSVAALIAETAEARVCGQSGVSPKCPTFDCDAIWGWCWYANGCCAGGLLKKICDCCETNYPNVHGYCPSGANVKCIVESCWADPRLQKVPLHRLVTDDPFTVARDVAFVRFPAGAPEIVLTDGADPLTAAIAGPVAGVLGAALFAVPRGPAGSGLVDTLRTLRAERVTVVGAALPPSLDASLQSAGLAVQRIGTAPDIAPFSGQVATWVREVNGATSTVCVAASGLSLASAPAAGAYGAIAGLPLVVGAEQAAAAEAPALLVGPEAAGFASQVPGSSVTRATTLTALAAELATRAMSASPAAAGRIALVARTSPLAAVLAAFGAPVALHEPGTLDGARDLLYARQDAHGFAARAYLAGATGRLGDPAVLELQSILNDFETRQLIGVAGQGLPVIPQPLAERCIGCARVGPATKETQKSTPSYWGDRAVDAGER